MSCHVKLLKIDPLEEICLRRLAAIHGGWEFYYGLATDIAGCLREGSLIVIRTKDNLITRVEVRKGKPPGPPPQGF